MPKIVDHTQRRNELLDAASEVLSRHGLIGLTTRRITDEAGEAKGALSHYFADKDDLVRQLLERFYARVTHRMQEAVAGKTGRTGLRALMIEALPLDDIRLEEAKAETTFVAASVGTPDMAVWYHRQRDLLRQALVFFIEQAVTDGELSGERSPSSIAAELLTLIDGLSLQAVLDPSPSHRRSQLEQLDLCFQRLADRHRSTNDAAAGHDR